MSFLDADDLYRPNKLSAQLAELAAHPEALLCLCHAENFWEPGLEDEERLYRAHGKVTATHHPASILARRGLFDRFPYRTVPDLISDDLVWLTRIHDEGVALRIHGDVLVDRRMHGASHSHTLAGLDVYLDLFKERVNRHRASARDGTQ